MIKKSSSIKKKTPIKLVNQGKSGYPSKPINYANFIER